MAIKLPAGSETVRGLDFMKGLTQVDNKGKNAAGREIKPVFPGKSLLWETANYGFVPVEVEAVCVQCVYSVCTVWPSSGSGGSGILMKTSLLLSVPLLLC